MRSVVTAPAAATVPSTWRIQMNTTSAATAAASAFARRKLFPGVTGFGKRFLLDIQVEVMPATRHRRGAGAVGTKRASRRMSFLRGKKIDDQEQKRRRQRKVIAFVSAVSSTQRNGNSSKEVARKIGFLQTTGKFMVSKGTSAEKCICSAAA